MHHSFPWCNTMEFLESVFTLRANLKYILNFTVVLLKFLLKYQKCRELTELPNEVTYP